VGRANSVKVELIECLREANRWRERRRTTTFNRDSYFIALCLANGWVGATFQPEKSIMELTLANP
jgi:hypothetical protein